MRTILVAMLAISLSQVPGLDEFLSNDTALRIRSKGLSQEEIILASIGNNDKLILSLANSYFITDDVNKNIARIPASEKVKKISDGLLINTVNPSDHRLTIMIYALPLKDHYLIQYRRLMDLPSGDIGYGTFRIIRKTGRKFVIGAKFEDTNLVHYIKSKKNKFVALDGSKLPWYWCGSTFIEKPFKISNGEITFTTWDSIPPNYAVMHGVKVDWHYNMKKSLLYCTNVHWDIHEQLPAPRGEEPKTVETTVRIPR